MTQLDWVLVTVGVLSIPLIAALRLAGLEFEAHVVFAAAFTAAVWAAVRALADIYRHVRMWRWAMTPPPPGTPDH
jgi:hypothetical protein